MSARRVIRHSSSNSRDLILGRLPPLASCVVLFGPWCKTGPFDRMVRSVVPTSPKTPIINYLGNNAINVLSYELSSKVTLGWIRTIGHNDSPIERGLFVKQPRGSRVHVLVLDGERTHHEAEVIFGLAKEQKQQQRGVGSSWPHCHAMGPK